MSQPLPARVMIAKPGLDGHDRGAVVVVQALHDAGLDVLYTGLRRTPEQIAIAAAQEDVDVLGVSCLSGAHMALLDAINQQFDKLAWRPTLMMAGGIIPDSDIEAIRTMGYRLVFGPGTPLESIAADIREHVAQRTTRTSASRYDWIQTARKLTELELGTTSAPEQVAKRSGKIIVVAGQGGVGKSTLLGAMLRSAQVTPTRIAVLANDPASAVTNGAILGDRLRMPMDIDPATHLIRSLPVRPNGDVIHHRTQQIAGYLAHRYDLVFVETIGVAQNQSNPWPWADRTVAVVCPGIGDHWQLRKQVLLESCHEIIITKCDLPDADTFATHLEQVLHDRKAGSAPDVCRVSHNDSAAAADCLKAMLAD